MLREPRLADPRVPGDQEQAPSAIDRVLQAGHQFRHFPVPAYEGLRSAPPGRTPGLNHRIDQPTRGDNHPISLVEPGWSARQRVVAHTTVGWPDATASRLLARLSPAVRNRERGRRCERGV